MSTAIKDRFIKIFGKRLLIKLNTILLFLPMLWSKQITTRIRILKNSNRKNRCLEIGSGNHRIDGFETLDVCIGRHVDYVCDASKKLPFQDNTFDIVYASHVLEHIVWYHVEAVLREWIRILKPAGQLEIWVPDGLKICTTLIESECDGQANIDRDGWYKFNPEKDPCVWAAGRFFSYGDGTGSPDSPNWHHSFFTGNYLKRVFEKNNLVDVQIMSNDHVRAYDHGWINLGVKGTKQ